MQLYVKCGFDNKPEFDEALEYLTSIVGGDIAYTGRDFDTTNEEWFIETYAELTQNQLNELTALCPIRPPRPPRQRSKQQAISKIAFGIGLHGGGYHPDDHMDEVTWEDCDILGLDPYKLTLDLMEEFGIIPEHLKEV